MNLFTRIVCFVLIVAALVLVFFRSESRSQSRSAGEALVREAERISGDRFPYFSRTPAGARVYSASTASLKLKRAIDKGLTELFEKAKEQDRRFRRSMRHSDYTVFVGKADRLKDAAGNYSPDIAVRAAQYAGTKYDKGGYIYAAGMVISLTSNAFLIADHSRDLDRVSRVVRFEGEHIVLYHNDRDRFNATADHSRGGGHPILK